MMLARTYLNMVQGAMFVFYIFRFFCTITDWFQKYVFFSSVTFYLLLIFVQVEFWIILFHRYLGASFTVRGATFIILAQGSNLKHGQA